MQNRINGDEFKLHYSHTSTLHKCNDFTQDVQENDDCLVLPIGEVDDYDFVMIGMFE